MAERPSASERPSGLPRWILGVGAALLLASFLSGLLVWWGQTAAQRLDPLESGRPFPTGFWVMVHGVLNPFLCVLFGYMCGHIPAGWRRRANRLSGLAMVMVFGGLILSGMGLYYAGGEGWRSGLAWTHRVLGLLLPLVIAGHGLATWRGSKRI